METEELTRSLRDATTGLDVRAGFATDVFQGARRRRRRARMTIAGTAAAVVALVGGVAIGGVVGGGQPTEAPVAAPQDDAVEEMFAGPPRGNLVHDQSFLDAAQQAWRDGVKKSPNGLADQVRGDPKVYWAGTTPVGKVALVGQPTVDSWAMGLVVGDPLKLVNETPFVSAERGTAFLFGPGDRYAIAFGESGDPVISPEWKQASDGAGKRTWTAMTTLDGDVRFAELPARTRPEEVRVGKSAIADATTSRDAHDLSLFVFPATRYAEGWERQTKIVIDNRLPWGFKPGTDVSPLVVRIGGAEPLPDPDLDLLFEAAEHARMQDPLLHVWLTGYLSVVADLSDGSHVEAVELQPTTSGPTGFYAVIDHPSRGESMVYGGPIDRDATLPARVKLPDDQGWIVAHYQADLRYRTSPDGAWLDAGTHGALLPADAAQVEVTLPGKAPEVVDLRG